VERENGGERGDGSSRCWDSAGVVLQCSTYRSMRRLVRMTFCASEVDDSCERPSRRQSTFDSLALPLANPRRYATTYV
jgi:hypothetical protein